MGFYLKVNIDRFKTGFRYKGSVRKNGYYFLRNKCLMFRNTKDGTLRAVAGKELIGEEFEKLPKIITPQIKGNILIVKLGLLFFICKLGYFLRLLEPESAKYQTHIFCISLILALSMMISIYKTLKKKRNY